jgi:hypothetical protein
MAEKLVSVQEMAEALNARPDEILKLALNREIPWNCTSDGVYSFPIDRILKDFKPNPADVPASENPVEVLIEEPPLEVFIEEPQQPPMRSGNIPKKKPIASKKRGK